MSNATATPAIAAAGYAVYQNGNAIYGVGSTREEAIRDAVQWMDGETVETISRELEATGANIHGALYCEPATQALMDEVKSRGGDIVYGRVDLYRGSIICTVEEERQFS